MYYVLECCLYAMKRRVVHCRATPEEVGFDKVAQQLKKYNIHGLLVVGGFEVHSDCFELHRVM